MINKIKKLIEFGWKINGDIDDEDVSLRRIWNLSEVLGGEFGSNGNLIEEEYIEYTIYPYLKKAYFRTWIKGQPKYYHDDTKEKFDDILEQALDDDLFMEIEFPKFEILIDSRKELSHYPYYDLVQLNENFSNSSVTLYKDEYFIHYIPGGGHSSIYYTISDELANELLEMDNYEAVNEMENYRFKNC